MTPRPATPPNHPTYNVRVAELTIRNIIRAVFSDAHVESVTQLESGKSFNNRIYFVDVIWSDLTAQVLRTHLVLKVCGQFWSATKVQNEVASISLLGTYCPTVPVPEIVAWSEDGYTLRVNNSKHGGILQTSEVNCQGRSWVLMTKLPGRVITYEDLQGPHGDELMKSLASMVALWRQNIPLAHAMGNLRFAERALESITPSPNVYLHLNIPFISLITNGILVSSVQPSNPITTAFELYKFRLVTELQSLRTKAIYASNRARLSQIVVSFIDRYLGHLTLFQSGAGDSHEIAFTHYDLSPRNILMSDNGTQPSTITGVVDLEFAGFFPLEEEFTNTLMNHAGDWPEASYNIFLQELEKLGVRTPLTGIGKSQLAWEQACALMRVIENIAPWWLSEDSGLNEQEKADELTRAAKKVEASLAFLMESRPSRSPTHEGFEINAL